MFKKSYLAIVIIFLVFTTVHLTAQVDCKGILKQAWIELQQQNLDQAFIKLQDLELCDYKNQLTKERLEFQQSLLTKIKAQKEATDVALAKADSILVALQQQQEENTRIINAFYFYQGKFALAFNNNRYGFIDKKGNIKIDYLYEECTPFDYTGYAKVKREKDAYLIDTSGWEYLLATDEKSVGIKTAAVDLRDQKKLYFPEELLNFQQLKILLLGSNHLNRIPDRILQLHQLSTLDLSSNGLVAIPATLGQLKNLRKLNIYNNNLSSVPTQLGNLHQLKSLNLSFNNLKEIPTEISQLKNLQSLLLHHNKLRIIIHSLAEMKELEYLTLENNDNLELPRLFHVLKRHPKKLYLSTDAYAPNDQAGTLLVTLSPWRKLPKDIAQLDNLQKLKLTGSKLSDEEKEALVKLVPVGCEIVWE